MDGGHVVVAFQEFLEWVVPFWTWVGLRRGPLGPRSLGDTFQCSRVVVGGPEGPVDVAGSFRSPNIAVRGPGGPVGVGSPFQSPTIAATGPWGSRLLWGLPLRLVLAPTAPEGPRAHVSCQDSRGIRVGARDVRRAPYYYYVVGYSGICAGGQVQSQFP